jgi:hypothetical protein
LHKENSEVRRFRGAAWRTTTIAGLVVLPALHIVILPADDGRATTVNWANRSSTWAPVTASRYPGAGDLDGDGDADLIVFDPIGALENTGPGSYPSWSARGDWVATLVLPEGCIFGADLGDLDGDGDSDLLVSIDGVGIVYFENTGGTTTPIWVRNDDYFVYPFYWPPSPSIVDLDGDSDADIALGGSHALGCIWNEGSSSEPVWVEDWAAFEDIHPNGEFIDLNFGDVDDDGDLDLLTAPQAFSGILQAYENAGDASNPDWVFNLDLITGLPQFDDMSGACLVDLSGDDNPDFLTLRAFSSSCYLNEGADTTAVANRSWGRIKSEFR